jgi:hypothetical protein
MEAIADSIRAARVASREMYTDGSITLEQYKNEKELQDKLVLDHIAWYKKMNLNFNELAFVGASGDGSAIF